MLYSPPNQLCINILNKIRILNFICMKVENT